MSLWYFSSSTSCHGEWFLSWRSFIEDITSTEDSNKIYYICRMNGEKTGIEERELILLVLFVNRVRLGLERYLRVWWGSRRPGGHFRQQDSYLISPRIRESTWRLREQWESCVAGAGSMWGGENRETSVDGAKHQLLKGKGSLSGRQWRVSEGF